MPNIDESMMKKMMGQMANMEPMDFNPLDVDVSVDAEDGETVALLLVGYAKGGRLVKAQAVDMDIGMDMGRKETGLKSMLSQKEDGEKEEE